MDGIGDFFVGVAITLGIIAALIAFSEAQGSQQPSQQTVQQQRQLEQQRQQRNRELQEQAEFEHTESNHRQIHTIFAPDCERSSNGC